MGDRPAAPAAFGLPVGGLIFLFRYDCLDVAFEQVGAVAAGGVDLVPGDRAGPGAGTSSGSADPDLLEDRDELRAVRGLPCGQDQGQGPAAAVGGQVDLAGLSASRAPEQGGFQAEFAPSPIAPPFGPAGVIGLNVSVLLRRAAPFTRAASASTAALSRASRTSSSRNIPAASW